MKKKIFGLLILMESLFLFLTTCVSLYYRETVGDDDFAPFATTTLLTFVVGGVLYLWGRRDYDTEFSRKDSFLVVALVWVVFSTFGMIPFLMQGTVDGLSDAFFEAMSGFTTTGASILTNIDDQPHGILFWRCLSHWMGGLGIIVFSFALIPVYELRNTNMFSAEVTGLSVDKLRPKIGDTARRLLLIYVLLTGICFGAFLLGKMDAFDAICYAMSTIATGGFANHQASLSFFGSAYLEYVCVLFMLVSGVNFSLYYYYSIGKEKVFSRNEEFHWYVRIVASAVVLFVILFYSVRHLLPADVEAQSYLPTDFESTFRTSLFHVTSIITTTGFQSRYFDYVAWGAPFLVPTLVLMIMGSCAGSTSGGVKIIRIIVCLKDAVNEFKLQLHPRAVIPVRLSGSVLPENKVLRALAFLFLYFLLVVIGTMLFTVMGVDLETSFGTAISALSNIGPGIGSTGPAESFAHLPAAGKWVCSLFMLVGRLEIFTVLFLFLPEFWKQKI